MEINIKNNSTFTFNTTGSLDSAGYRFFMDNDNKIILPKNPEYGFYNKIINIKFSKFIYLNKVYIGLGDIIDFFTRKLYIKNLIVYLTNGNCGCEARRIKFNKFLKIPFIKLYWREVMANDENRIESLKQNKKSKTDKQLNKEMLNIYTYNIKNDIARSKDVDYIDEKYIKEEFIKLTKTEKIKLIEKEKQFQIIKNLIRSSDKKEFNLNNIKVVPDTEKINKFKPVEPKEIRGGCGCKNKK